MSFLCGCSFLLFLIQTLGTKLDKTMYLAFEYAHLLIFFLALVSRWAANPYLPRHPGRHAHIG